MRTFVIKNILCLKKELHLHLSSSRKLAKTNFAKLKPVLDGYSDAKNRMPWQLPPCAPLQTG